MPLDLETHINRQAAWSHRTLGPGRRTVQIRGNVHYLLGEVVHSPTDICIWAEIIRQGLDGAFRAGHTAEDICTELERYQAKQEAKVHPDWRNAREGNPNECERGNDASGSPADIGNPSGEGNDISRGSAPGEQRAGGENSESPDTTAVLAGEGKG